MARSTEMRGQRKSSWVTLASKQIIPEKSMFNGSKKTRDGGIWPGSQSVIFPSFNAEAYVRFPAFVPLIKIAAHKHEMPALDGASHHSSRRYEQQH